VRLMVHLPDEVLLDEEVGRVSAEAEDGAFTLLPRHVDFVTALAPGLLSYATPGGRERFLAVDRGILVKSGREVRVSVMDAVAGEELGRLRQAVAERFQRLDERRRRTRSVLARLEVDFVRRVQEAGR
jgi:F-type H+-transporting ATPase subunit epsilon